MQQSLQQLQAFAQQLKSQVDATSSASVRSDLLALDGHLTALEHSLLRQQEMLQVLARRASAEPKALFSRRHSLCVCVHLQSESLACEAFREQLNTLVSKAEEAEEVLKESDPVSSEELSVVQTRMDKLKVFKLKKKELFFPGAQKSDAITAWRNLPLADLVSYCWTRCTC